MDAKILENKIVKLNYDFLLKNRSKAELQNSVKILGKKYSKNYKKSQLIKIILNNSKMMTEDDIVKYEYEKKLNYYKDLSNRLYSQTIKKENI